MAEILTPTAKQNQNKKLVKKSTKVDLTPMVDLGFLLITFFVFTTAMTTPKALKLMIPKDGKPTTLQQSKVLTVIPMEENKIKYYEGQLQQNSILNETTNSGDGIRKIILEKKQKIKLQFGTDDMVLIIKPANESDYKNFVNILDEVSIDAIKFYFIDKLNDEEKLLLKN